MKSLKMYFFAIASLLLMISISSCTTHQRVYRERTVKVPRPGPAVALSLRIGTGGGYGGSSYGYNRQITPYYNGYANNRQCYHRGCGGW